MTDFKIYLLILIMFIYLYLFIRYLVPFIRNMTENFEKWLDKKLGIENDLIPGKHAIIQILLFFPLLVVRLLPTLIILFITLFLFFLPIFISANYLF